MLRWLTNRGYEKINEEEKGISHPKNAQSCNKKSAKETPFLAQGTRFYTSVTSPAKSDECLLLSKRNK